MEIRGSCTLPGPEAQVPQPGGPGAPAWGPLLQVTASPAGPRLHLPLTSLDLAEDEVQRR